VQLSHTGIAKRAYTSRFSHLVYTYSSSSSGAYRPVSSECGISNSA